MQFENLINHVQAKRHFMTFYKSFFTFSIIISALDSLMST